MSKLIFAHSSYFLCIGGSPETEKVMRESALLCRFRPFFCHNLAEAKSAFGVMKRIIGAFIFFDEIAPGERGEVLDLLKEVPFAVRVLSTQPLDLPGYESRFVRLPDGEIFDLIRDTVQGVVQAMVPRSLDRLAHFAAQAIFPTFFPSLKPLRTVELPPEGFDRQINYYTVSDQIIGQCVLKADTSKICKAMPTITSEKVNDLLRESLNQFLGMISKNLSRLDYGFKIGLPMSFDLQRVPEVQTLVFFPSLHLVDGDDLLHLSLGYTDLSAQPLFDLSNFEPQLGSEEIEFL